MVEWEKLRTKVLKRKFTYICDWSVPAPPPTGMAIFDSGYGALGVACGKPARRLYSGEFGDTGDRWYCPEHMEQYIERRVSLDKAPLPE